MNTAELHTFLFQLWQQGLELWLESGQLRFKGNQSLLAGENLNTLRQYKEEIIALLQQQPKLYSGFMANQGQRGIYFMQQLASNSSIYHQACLLRLNPEIDVKQLKTSLLALTDRHDVLRSQFSLQEGVIKQFIDAELVISLNTVQLQAEQSLEQWYQAQAEQPFDSQNGPLFRAQLLRHENTIYLLITAHHLIADFWAMQRLIHDWQALYLQQDLVELGKSFKELNLQEQQWLTSEQGNAAKDFWHEQLSPLPEPLDLPFDFSPPAQSSFQGKELSFTLPAALSRQLKQQAKAFKTTPFAWTLSCLQLLLHRYSGRDDICIGSPVANRLQRDSQLLAGHFANPLVLRQQFQQTSAFSDLVESNKQLLSQAFRHQQYPIQRLIEELQPQQTLPFFQVAMAWSQLDSLNLEPQFAQSIDIMEQRGAIYPLVLSCYDAGENIRFSWRFNSDLYRSSTIERYHEHLLNCLQNSLANPEQSTADITFLTEDEQQLYHRINQTDADIPRTISIAKLFENVVEKHPNNIAFRDVQKDKNYSYQALNQYANQIAHFLQTQGLAAGDVVGLALGRCYENTACVLACVKSGIVYIPIDPDNPDERINQIQQSAEAKAIISHSPRAIRNNLALEQVQNQVKQQSNSWQITAEGFVDEDATACIFYTSGSTGTPKGVEIPHRAIVRLTHNTNFADYQADERFCHICNTAFDASNVEIWSALLHGGCLLYLDNNSLLNPASFAEFVQQEKPTATVMTTALFNLFVQYQADIFKDFRYVMFGGEAADKHICNICIRSGKPENLLNVYGPTENGTYSTVYLFEKPVENAVPIGFVVNNSQAYIYDQYNQLAPIGVIGELIVGGDGVATGYYKQPELTAQQFLNDTYRGKGKLYRTGDLAWLREDGMVMYAGRADEQVKLRGFRIETGEVEQYLLSIAGIEQAFVDVDKSKNHLIAWLVSNAAIDSEAIKQQLMQQLPDFMVPAAFVLMDALPLTANGKVDKRQLPEPIIEITADYLAPKSSLEKQLCQLWQQQFQQEKIGILDNFFDLGGHSLMAAKISAAIEEELNRHVDMRMIFTHPTIQSLATAIEQQNIQALPSITAQQHNDAIPASLSQQRLWFLQQLNPNSTAYNMPLVLQLKQAIKAETIEQAINALIQRHDALHTGFTDYQGEAFLAKNPNAVITLTTQTISSQHELEQAIDALSQSIFNLSQAPLIKAQLLQQGSQQYLLLCLHHIAIDGISANYLLSELAQLLQGKTLAAPPAIAYSDFSLWQQQAQALPAWQQQIDYWQQALADVPASLNLPTDKPRPAVFGGNAEKIQLILNAEQTQLLEQFAKQQQVSPFMLLMAGFAILLQRYSQQEQFCIGFPIAGRNQAAVQNTVGLFVNNLAVPYDFSQALNVGELLQQSKQQVLQAFAHQDLPFDHIIEALNTERSLNYMPYLQVSFAYEDQNIHERVQTALGDQFQLIEAAKQAAKYDLNLSCFKQDNGEILAEFEYSNALFEANTIKQWAAHYQRILQAFTEAEKPINEIQLLSEQEQQSLLQVPHSAENPAHVITQFSTMAERFAQRSALSFEQHTINYQSLDAITNQLAHSLKAQGIKQGDFIGLYFDRSLEMVYTILALFKIGAAYVPLDPHSPIERVNYIIEDAKLHFVIGEAENITQLKVTTLSIENLLAQSQQFSIQAPSCELKLSDAAYVIYTSGTTGNPKGCVVSQANLARLFTSSDKDFGFNEHDVWTLFHSYAFDFSVWEMWGALLYGGELVVIPYWLSRSSQDFYQLLADKKVSVLNQTPSAFTQIIQADQNAQFALNLRYIIFGGEALDFHALKQWTKRHPLQQTQLINMYGITETTVHVTYYVISENDFIQPRSIIGKALSDLHIYLLDAQQNLVPNGMVGEMYISGPGVTQGYLHRPDLSAERFIANPFLSAEQAPQHTVLYRSGDLAKRLANSNLEYLGRCDHQVKIRGHRIELGEIEAALNQLPSIQESPVRTYEDDYGLQLIAWFISKELTLDSSTLRKELQKQLPDYMLPSAFIALETWPLTANGKVDMKALPQADFSTQQKHYTPPSNETEKTLCTLWQEVLNLEQVGIHDNFFELGGHSLLATKLAARIRSELQCELALQQLFEYPTIAELAVVLLEQEIQQLDVSDEDLLALLEGLEN